MGITNVRVAIPGHIYTVHIGSGLLDRADEFMRRSNRSRRCAIITDDQAGSLYGVPLSATLTRGEYRVTELGLPAGEQSKSWDVVGQLLEACADGGLGRNDLIIGLGGGVVGDIAGFTAAVYLRGVQYAAIPTTLLAMVDSSVGGKTGVNLRAGKNLVGAFKQPELVLIDTNVLSSLPDREWRSGFAEIAKSALIDSKSHWKWFNAHATDLAQKDPKVVQESIERCVKFKSNVVARDEQEEGPRECLNYGHTFGHALEKIAGYGTFSHGEAVAEGMRFAARLSAVALGMPVELVHEQDALLDTLGLKTLDLSTSVNELLDAMHSDKKARDGNIRFVLPTAPGVWECSIVDKDLLRRNLEGWVRSKEILRATNNGDKE